jgi:hypothetical protein
MNMINKILLICLLSVSYSVQAEWEASALFGVSAGYMRENGLYSVDTIYKRLPGIPNLYYNDGEHNNGYAVGVLTGIQATCADWLVGLELRINRYDTTHHRYFNYSDFPQLGNTLRTWSADAKTEYGTDVGLLMRVGYAMAPSILPYMHLGAETSRDTMEIVISGASELYPSSVLLRDTKQIYRFTGGVGIELPAPWLYTLSFRLEYMFHIPGSFLEASAVLQDGIIDPFFKANIKPSTQSITLAVVWNIG